VSSTTKTPGPLDPRVLQRLTDLVDQAGIASRLVARGKPTFDEDEMLRFAGESLLIRMGECVDRIDKTDPHFVASHAELELRPLKDTRNLVAHGYDIVDHDFVWVILERHIPPVALAVRQFLARKT